MMECTDIFWHEFYRTAGVSLGILLPLLLGFGAMMLAIFRQQHRHEEAMQEARLRHEEAMREARIREDQVRESRYRVIQGGQG
jgi:hypothetical protein